jgi:VCBS repeat-containing protein
MTRTGESVKFSGAEEQAVVVKKNIGDKSTKDRVEELEGTKSRKFLSQLLTLEPRILFDGAGFVTGAEFVDASEGSSDFADAGADRGVEGSTDQNDGSELLSALGATGSTGNDRVEIVFVDTSVEDYQTILASFDDSIEVVLLDSESDGVEQLAAVLDNRQNVDAVHIISHGQSGSLQLGTAKLTQATINGEYSDELVTIGRALNASGDILIYGCDFGRSDVGEAAVSALAKATGADIAASDDLTGAASRGGDWELETRAGFIETTGIEAVDFDGVLLPVNISAPNGSLSIADNLGNPSAVANPAGVGFVATWANAGTVGGVAIDVKATVLSLGPGDSLYFEDPSTIGTDDLSILLFSEGVNNPAEATIRWEIVVAGTNTAASGDIEFTIADIDGIGGVPNTRETVLPSLDHLSRYGHDAPTNLVFSTSAAGVEASGTQDQNGETTSAANFLWQNVSNWDVTYKVDANALTSAARSTHDGDGDFAFVNRQDTYLLSLDNDGNDSTAAGTAYAGSFVEDAGPVSIVDTDVAISQNVALGGMLDSATVKLSNAQLADVMSVGGLPAGIVATVDTSVAGEITVTLTGNASVADYETALKAVMFENTSQAPAEVDRNFEISVFNGTFGTTSNLANSTISVTPVNDVPIAVDDADSTDENTVIAANAANGVITPNDSDVDGDVLQVSAVNGVGGSVGNQIALASGALLTLNGDGSYDYDPNGSFESLAGGQTATDTFTYTVSDGNGATDTATVTITINGVNDAPALSNDVDGSSLAPADDFEDTYVENALAISLVDVDSAVIDAEDNIVEMVVTLVDGQIGDTINFPSMLPGNISAAVMPGATLVAPGPLTITFTGDASTTTADWNSVLQSLAFLPSTNDVHNPDPTDRHFTFQVSDSEGAASNITNTTIHVVPQNDPPTLDLDDDNSGGINAGNFSGSFTEGSGGTPIHSNIIITDLDDSNLQSASVTLSNPKPGDEFIIDGTVVSAGDSGTVNGINYTVSTGLGGEIIILLSGNATIADYDAALEVIQFNNTSNNPDTTQRTIDVFVNDGTDNSPTRTAFIDIVPVNDPPVLDLDGDDSTVAGSGFDGTYTENDPAMALGDVDLGIADPDDINMESATIVLTNAMAGDLLEVGGLPAGIVANIDNSIAGQVTVSLSGSASVADYEAALAAVTFRSTSENPDTSDRIINLSVNDGDVGSNIAVSTLHVVAVNDVPVVTAPLADQSSNDGNSGFSMATAASFDDVDGDTLTFSLAPGAPAWLTIDANTGVVSVNGSIPADASQNTNIGGGAAGTYDVTVVASDPSLTTAQDTFRITIGNLPPVAVADTSSDTEDATQTGNVLSDPLTGDADTAPDSDLLTVTGVSGGAIGAAQALTYGDLTVNADGSWTFVPNATANALAVGATVTETVTYTVDDGNGGTDTTTLTVELTGVNDVPVVVDPANPGVPPADPDNIIPDVTTTDGGVPVAINVDDYLDDPDGDVLSFSATGLPAGLVIDPLTGIISGTIDNSASQGGSDPVGAPGVYQVVVTGDDGNGGTVTTTITYSVSNLAPVAQDDAGTTDEDSVLTGGNVISDPLSGDADTAPDTDVLDVSEVAGAAGNVGNPVAGSAGGLFTINSDGSYSFDPDGDFEGLAVGETRDTTIEYQISDGEGGFDTAVLTVTVTGVNDGPVAAGPVIQQSVSDGETIAPVDTSGSFNNPNGDPIVYSATDLPPGLSIDPVTGIISGTIGADASLPGGYTTLVTATTPTGETATSSVLWTVSNVDPVAVDDATATALDTPVTINPLGNDADGAPDSDVLAVTGATAPANGSVVVNPDGRIDYTPNAGFTGTDTFTYTVSDGQGGTDTATVTVSVGVANLDVPTSTPIVPAALVDGEVIAPIDVSGSFVDPNGDPLVYSAIGLPEGLVIDPATGVISGTVDPDASEDGPYNVQITAMDPSGNQVTEPMTVSVSNPAPVAMNDSADTPLDTPVTINVLGNDNDPDGDVLNVALINDQPASGSVVINPDGTIAYTPNAGFIGSDTFTYIVDDGNGGRDEATVTINVGVVDPNTPTSTPIPAETVDDGTPITPIDTSASFADPDGDPLTYSATGLPDGLTIDPATGVISGTPVRDASEEGPYSVLITASDPAGNQVSEPMTINVNNPAPVAADDGATTKPESPVVINVVGNDSDRDGDEFAVTGTTAPANGSVTINDDGTVTYTPNAGFSGADSFDYTITDEQGATSTATVTVIVTDTPITLGTNDNVPPVTTSDGATPATIDASDYLADPDGDTLNFGASGLPTGLVIDPVTGIISGTVDNSASQGGNDPVAAPGVYVVTLTGTDTNGASVTTTITYTVSNLAPVAQDDAGTQDEDSVLTGGNVITDPLTGDADRAPDSDVLEVSEVAGVAGNVGNLVAGSTGGLFTINSDGSYSFDPDGDFEGLAVGETRDTTIEYQVWDGEGGFDTAVLTITVTGVNDAPVPVDPVNPGAVPANPGDYIPSQSVLDGEAVTPIDMSSYFHDPDGSDELTVSIDPADLPPGLHFDPVTGVISGTPTNDASQGGDPANPGTYVVPVTVDDGHGGSFTTQITYQVGNPVPGSGFLPDLSALDSDELVIPTAGEFIDPDGDVLHFSATGLPEGLDIDPVTGVISGQLTATASVADPYNIVVTADDGQGGVVSIGFVLSVDPSDVPLPPESTVTGNVESDPVNITFDADGEGHGELGDRVNGLEDLGGLPFLDHPVITSSVAGMADLASGPDFGGSGIIGELVRWIGEQGTGWMDHLLSDQNYNYYAGQSLDVGIEFGAGGQENSLQISTLVVDDAVFLELTARGTGAGFLSGLQVLAADGSPMPENMLRIDAGSIVINKVVGNDWVALKLRNQIDGQISEFWDVKINTASGEIVITGHGGGDQALLPFNDQLEQFANYRKNELETLLNAIVG